MLDLSMLDEPAVVAGGQPLLLQIDMVDEDPEQPRVEFDDAALRELADTIRARGVRQPVSVRPHPSVDGRWMLNFGARRLRASRMAGKAAIPAFVDTAADSYDQVIENEQRLGLTHMELALFVKRRLVAGESQSDIARGLGKSKALVSYATALIDPPDWLLQLYRDGVCTGIWELYELRRLHGAHGEVVASWAAGMEAISRRDVMGLKLRLAAPVEASKPGGAPAPADGLDIITTGAPAGTGASAEGPSDVDRPRKRRLGLIAELADRVVHLLLDVAPSEEGSVYVRPEGGGERLLVPLGQLRLVRVGEICGA